MEEEVEQWNARSSLSDRGRLTLACLHTSLTTVAHIILHHSCPNDGPKPDPPLRATQLVLISQHRYWFILIDTGKSWRHLETLAWVYESVAFLGSGMGARYASLAHDGLISALSLYGYWLLKTGGASFISQPHLIVIQA